MQRGWRNRGLRRLTLTLRARCFKEGGHYNRSIVDLLLKEKIKLFQFSFSLVQSFLLQVDGHCFRNCLMTKGSNVYDHDCLPHGSVNLESWERCCIGKTSVYRRKTWSSFNKSTISSPGRSVFSFNYLKRLPVLKSNQYWDIEFELLNSPVKQRLKTKERSPEQALCSYGNFLPCHRYFYNLMEAA